jgi:hypothetical protein
MNVGHPSQWMCVAIPRRGLSMPGKLVWGNQAVATCELRTQTLGLFKQSHSVPCAFVAIV